MFSHWRLELVYAVYTELMYCRIVTVENIHAGYNNCIFSHETQLSMYELNNDKNDILSYLQI